MDNEMTQVLQTPDEDLLPCPMCAGKVRVVSTNWQWGPYDLRHAKFRCDACGALFEYAWRTDPYRHVPHAIEWWNNRAPNKPTTCEGYNVEQLLAVAELLKDNNIMPADLQQLCNNMTACVEIAQKKFMQDLDRQLQEMLSKG